MGTLLPHRAREREPIIGVWGQSPQQGPGKQGPWSGVSPLSSPLSVLDNVSVHLHVTIKKSRWHFPLPRRQFPLLNFLVNINTVHAYIIVLPNLMTWKFPWMFNWRLILIIQALLSPVLALFVLGQSVRA